MTDVPLPKPLVWLYHDLRAPLRSYPAPFDLLGSTYYSTRRRPQDGPEGEVGLISLEDARSYGEACAQAERERLTAEIRTLRGFVVHYGGWKGEQALAGLDAPSPARSDLGVPASPSGSTLQPPSSASAAIPDAAGVGRSGE